MRFLPALLFVCLLALLSLPGGAAAAPSCSEGPTTVGETTYGTPCADVIVVPASVEDVKGGGGDDVIVPGPITAATSCPDGCRLGVGSQTFEGGEGDDVVFGERGNDTLRGGPGNDQLFGGIGDDLLEGGPGNDRLLGGFGGDSIDGQEGDDYVRGDSTIDRIFDTGGGTDTLSYSTGVTPGFEGTVNVPGFPAPGGERGLRLDMRAGERNANNGLAPLGGGVDEVEAQSFETVIGSPFSDYLIGTGAPQAFYGGGGADVLLGEGGADTLVGGADGDNVDAGGIDTRDTSKVSVGSMTPPGASGYAQLYLVGSNGNDGVSASYSPGSVSFHLAAGTFDSGSAEGCSVTATDATCSFGEPLDSVLLAGMGGNDTIAASGFPATVSVVAIGGEGNDSVAGGEESEDILVDGPGGGGDVLSALGGDDALTHNGGADELLGGSGNDLFLSASTCDGERIAGGEGRDNASWAQSDEGVEANLASGAAGRPGSGETPDCGGEPLDSLTEIEDLEGSSSKTSGDVFYGDAGPNQLLGRPGPDTYYAGPGEDSILANSGDADLTINCGPDDDDATIDRPQYGDPAPVECESVYEADPNNFRTRTLLPPPPLPEPPPPAPPADTRPPQTRLGAHPRALLLTRKQWRRVAFRFSASEAGSSFRCKLDRKPYRPCASPRAYRVKAGRHSFRVFAIDAAGNRDRTPVAFRFRVVRR
ncbi:MAG TPA: calcium-binding protein [Solirubrobacterales bacterium]|nr:calcium-binding protein [Solirubrobacterales bacterium]